MTAGNAYSSDTPKPAVRLVPRNTMAGTSVAGGAWGARAAVCGERAAVGRSTRSGVSSAEPQAATSRTTATIFRPMMIIAKGLGQTYSSGGRPLTVLHDINLSIEPRGFVAIVGPSGSGKTTLLGLLAGLDQASAGSVSLDGVDLASLTEDGRAKFRAERVGFVFQSFQLIPTLTALENVLVPFELLNDSSANGTEPEARAVDLLTRVGLQDRVDHYPSQLSGGEQQRVALARAFANRPKILFADEPTGNLDAATGHTIIDLMVELNRDAETTLVLVTHDPELAARANRTIRLSGGIVVEDDVNERA